LKRHPKVLHIVESLDRGAVENWLIRMMAHAHAQRVPLDWTFYCQLADIGVQENRVREMGGQIVHSPVPLGRTRAFMSALRAELSRGEYEIMHCHHDLVSSVYLIASTGLPIGRRLVHVHNADENLPTASATKASLLREPIRRICLSADRVIGISNHTLDTFLAGRARRADRDLVHYYGVDPTPFIGPAPNRVAMRRSLSLADDSLILLFGGRITPEKNPVFCVDVLAALAKVEPRAVGVFAGAGSLEEGVRRRASELGVSDRVKMIGWRSDLPSVMRASDWFILPRPEQPLEGFGLAVVEAQLAGLRMLLSLGVPDDPLLSNAAYRRLSLRAGAEAWAEAAVDLMQQSAPCERDTLSALAESPMDMNHALNDLLSLHE